MEEFPCVVAALFGALEIADAAEAEIGKAAVTAAPVPSTRSWRRETSIEVDDCGVGVTFMALISFRIGTTEANGVALAECSYSVVIADADHRCCDG